MIDRIVEVIDRSWQSLQRRTGATFAVACFPFVEQLKRDPRTASILDELRRENLRSWEKLGAAREEARTKTLAIFQELRALRPDIFPAVPAPQGYDCTVDTILLNLQESPQESEAEAWASFQDPATCIGLESTLLILQGLLAETDLEGLRIRHDAIMQELDFEKRTRSIYFRTAAGASLARIERELDDLHPIVGEPGVSWQLEARRRMRDRTTGTLRGALFGKRPVKGDSDEASGIRAKIDELRVDTECLYEEIRRQLGSKQTLAETSLLAMAGDMWTNNIADYRGRVHIAIVTIKSIEEDEVLRCFPRQHSVRGERDYGLCYIDSVYGDRLLVASVRQPKQGNIYANTVTRDLIKDLDPSWILLVGIAGASPFGDAIIGDVVLGTHVHDLTVHARNADGSSGFSTGGGAATVDVEATVMHLRPVLAEAIKLAGPGSVPAATCLAFTTDDDEANKKITASLKSRMTYGGTPRVIDGPIISTDALVKDVELVKQWRSTMRNVHAIEMESAGAYNATRTRAKTYAMLPIRGISDIVGLEKQERAVIHACKIAADCALALVRHWRPERLEGAPTHTPLPALEPATGGPDEDLEAIELLEANGQPVSAFEPVMTSMVSTQRITKGREVVPVLWRLDAVPSAKKGWTKAQIHQAIENAIPSIDGGTGRRTRLPAVLRTAARRREDGTQIRSLVHQGLPTNVQDEEQFGARPDGTIWFQRAHFWDFAEAVLDMGQCAYDAIAFVRLIVGVGNALGIAGYGVTLAVQAPRTGMVVTIQTNGLMKKQPMRTARIGGELYEGHVDVHPLTSLPDAVQARLVQQLVDGVANDCELEGDPFGGGGGAPFLEIDETSIEAVLKTFR